MKEKAIEKERQRERGPETGRVREKVREAQDRMMKDLKNSGTERKLVERER